MNSNVAIITGAASGLGLEIALDLLSMNRPSQVAADVRRLTLSQRGGAAGREQKAFSRDAPSGNPELDLAEPENTALNGPPCGCSAFSNSQFGEQSLQTVFHSFCANSEFATDCSVIVALNEES